MEFNIFSSFIPLPGSPIFKFPYVITFNPNDPNAHFPIHSQPPNFQPAFTAPTEELTRMTARAGEVIRLLEVLRDDTPIFPSSFLSYTSTSSFA